MNSDRYFMIFKGENKEPPFRISLDFKLRENGKKPTVGLKRKSSKKMQKNARKVARRLIFDDDDEEKAIDEVPDEGDFEEMDSDSDNDNESDSETEVTRNLFRYTH